MNAAAAERRTHRRRDRWLWIAGAAVVPAVLVVLRAQRDGDARYVFEARLLYWTTALVVAIAIAAGCWRWRAAATPTRDALRRWWPGIVSAVALTATVFWLVPPRMRVQFDETSLVNTSLTMHEQRADLMVTSAVPFDGELVGIERTIDKRPPLFSFLVSVVHDVAGPRIANAYAVNAALLAIALFLAFAFVRAHLGLAAAFAAQLSLLAVPLTTVVATCAGFDLLAAVLLGATLLAARGFVHRPDRVRGVMFVAVGLLFAWSRYESLFALALLAAVVGWRVRGRWTPSRAELVAFAAVPALITPLAFLLLISRHPNFYPEAGGGPLLAWSHAADHLGPLLVRWFDPALANALPGVVAIAAAAAWGAWFVRRRTVPRDALLLVPVLGVTVLVLFWFASDPRDEIAVRLYLPLAFCTALSPLLLLAAFGERGARAAPWLLGAVALLAAVRVNELRRGASFPRLHGELLLDAVEAAIARPDLETSTTLWVTTIAQHLVTTRRAAVSPAAFVNQANDIQRLVAARRVTAIYLLETPDDGALAGGFGDPSEVLARTRSAVVLRTTGDLPITVHRLQ